MATYVKRVTYQVDVSGDNAPKPKTFEGTEARARDRAETWAQDQRAAGRTATVNRKSVRYQARVRLKGHAPQSAAFARLTDAKRWAQGIETAIHEGRHFKTTEAKRHTLDDLIARYARDVLPTKKANTQHPQMGQLAYWRRALGVLTLADCTPAAIAAQRDILASEPIKSQATPNPQAPPRRTPATVNRYLAALSHVFTFAVKELGWIEDNPLTKVTKGKEPRGRVRFLSEDERDRLLSACRASTSPDLYPAVVLALSTGARQMEILGLRWGQIDLSRCVATLDDTKNGERRVLPLTGHALELLKARAKVRRIDTDLVFPGRDRPRDATGKPAPPAPIILRAAFDTALKRAGIENFRWHDLRHTAASYLAMNGASLAEIAEILGHKTLAMVKRYSHLSEAHTARIVERMNRQMFKT